MTLIHWQPTRRRRINWLAVESFGLALAVWFGFWAFLVPALINAVMNSRGF